MPPCSRPLGEVAVAPDAGEALEVGGAVFRAVGIVPEADRHRRERRACRRARPCSPASGLAVVVEDVDLHAEPAALDLAAPDRQRRIAEHEAGDDVGAAGDRGEVHVALDRVVDVVEALRRQRRAGRERSCARVERSCVSRGRSPAFLHRVDELRRGAEDACIRSASAKSNSDVAVGMERRAVVEQQRRAERERPRRASSTSSSRRS